jgi:hypothetical protein
MVCILTEQCVIVVTSLTSEAKFHTEVEETKRPILKEGKKSPNRWVTLIKRDLKINGIPRGCAARCAVAALLHQTSL